MRCQLGNVARLPPTLPYGVTPEPGDQPHHMHGGGCEDLLEGRARSADVATLTQTKAPDALGETALHS
jgi:hypothetical protein